LSRRKGGACNLRLSSTHESWAVISQGWCAASLWESVGGLVGRCRFEQSERPDSRQVHYCPTQVC